MNERNYKIYEYEGADKCILSELNPHFSFIDQDPGTYTLRIYTSLQERIKLNTIVLKSTEQYHIYNY